MKRLIVWIKTHTYSLALTYWPYYLVAFFSLEHWRVPKYTIQCFLDEKIPFCEWFVIPYLLWFPLLAVSLLFFMIKSKEDFQNLCFLMFSGMTICLMIYGILPTGLSLRCEVVNKNLLCQVVNLLYQVDTPTNVCPSIHVASTVAINRVVHRSPLLEKHKKILWGSSCLTLFICLSTLLIKQHAIIDVICGYFLTELLYQVTYRLDWRKHLARTRLRILL